MCEAEAEAEESVSVLRVPDRREVEGVHGASGSAGVGFGADGLGAAFVFCHGVLVSVRESCPVCGADLGRIVRG